MKELFVLILFLISFNHIKAQGFNSLKEKNPYLYIYPEIHPEFPGGEAELYKYIQDNLRLNDSLINSGFKGTLRVGFLVSKEGSIKDIKIIKSAQPEIDKEAIRLIKAMPNWKPAQRDGVAIEMWYQIPIQICPQ